MKLIFMVMSKLFKCVLFSEKDFDIKLGDDISFY